MPVNQDMLYRFCLGQFLLHYIFRQCADILIQSGKNVNRFYDSCDCYFAKSYGIVKEALKMLAYFVIIRDEGVRDLGQRGGGKANEEDGRICTQYS